MRKIVLVMCFALFTTNCTGDGVKFGGSANLRGENPQASSDDFINAPAASTINAYDTSYGAWISIWLAMLGSNAAMLGIGYMLGKRRDKNA